MRKKKKKTTTLVRYRNPIILSAIFSGYFAGQIGVAWYNESTKKQTNNKLCQERIPSKVVLQNQRKDKKFPDKQKLKEFTTTRKLALQ